MELPKDYFSSLLRGMSDLETTKAKNAKAEFDLHELEAKIAELEESEQEWKEKCRILLHKIEDENEKRT